MEASSVLHLLMRVFHQVWEADEWYCLLSRTGLKAEFQISETTSDLLYTLMSHRPNIPFLNKRVGGGCICLQLMLSADEFLVFTLQARCDEEVELALAHPAGMPD